MAKERLGGIFSVRMSMCRVVVSHDRPTRFAGSIYEITFNTSKFIHRIQICCINITRERDEDEVKF